MKRLEIYRCAVCGAVIEVTTDGAGQPSCCGTQMQLMAPQTAEYKLEKHVPYPTALENGMTVAVGKEMAHPMTPEHHIVWIEVVNGPYVNRKYLQPNEKPEAAFHVPLQKGMVVREYCNIHGLWEYIVE